MRNHEIQLKLELAELRKQLEELQSKLDALPDPPFRDAYLSGARRKFRERIARLETEIAKLESDNRRF